MNVGSRGKKVQRGMVVVGVICQVRLVSFAFTSAEVGMCADEVACKKKGLCSVGCTIGCYATKRRNLQIPRSV